ncbi:uncharacterized protein LOC130752952 [Actinidia eriantha]|uniref:uncharacterized protein LOC130752952 n=1 Tax=Actinidia eriantha TaxID=165200 RepID=UPI00258E0B69|nr:uncharacterized protein LOC130752952 [Actinidia eriantha]
MLLWFLIILLCPVIFSSMPMDKLSCEISCLLFSFSFIRIHGICLHDTSGDNNGQFSIASLFHKILPRSQESFCLTRYMRRKRLSGGSMTLDKRRISSRMVMFISLSGRILRDLQVTAQKTAILP